MTARDRNLMAPQGQVSSFMASVRRQQSGTYDGNYDERTREGIGAYGIAAQNWRIYATAAGRAVTSAEDALLIVAWRAS